jgi:hypothetical protein
MTAQQVQLKAIQRIGRNLHLREGSESCVDTVHRLIARRLAVHHGTRGVHAVDRRRRKIHGLEIIRDGHQLFERQ